MVASVPDQKWKLNGTEFIRVAALAIVVILIWCSVYNRWTLHSWQTPLTYLETEPFRPDPPDVLYVLARIKGASEGGLLPFVSSSVPQLGAPFTGNWNDFPTIEKPLYCLAGLLTNLIGLFAAANLMVLLGQILAAEAFYLACRFMDGAWIWAFTGALVFAFSHYMFAHGFNHLIIMYCWHVPLGLLVIEWIVRGKGLQFGDRKFNFSLIVGVFFGVQNQYFSYLFAQMVCLAGLVQMWRRGWRQLLPVAAIVATTTVSFLLMIFNTLLYGLLHGSNGAAVERKYRELEIYGLKLIDLVMPFPEHRFSLFFDWSNDHLSNVFLHPGEFPPADYLGLIGIAALVWLVVFSLARLLKDGKIPLKAWLILWIVLYATVGGIHSILGSLGFVLLRATSRYSIFVLCLALMFAVRRMTLIHFPNKLRTYSLAILIVVIAIWDQSPPFVTSDDIEKTSAAVASDRHMVEVMEKRLPPNAMVFELPILEFPENALPGSSDYVDFRPYLFTNHLRFSYGSDKGRPRAQWQIDLYKGSFDAAVADIERYGFVAVFIVRDVFPHKGEDFIAVLKKMGRNEIFESDRKDLVCVMLKPSPSPVLPGSH
jgi:hypothetical protein